MEPRYKIRLGQYVYWGLSNMPFLNDMFGSIYKDILCMVRLADIGKTEAFTPHSF